MNKLSLISAFVVLLYSSHCLVAQDVNGGDSLPKSFPTIMVKDQVSESSTPLRMYKLNVDVKIVGTMATTTMEMHFRNDSSRVLEGSLFFPLDDGQTISRFAMDVNGKLREGVVVEKAKGRQTFEEIVRKQVDPGLLEWTKGNNFKARVYPIPAEGTKTILIAYEQELPVVNGNPLYLLPLKFKDILDEFSMKVQVHKQNTMPLIKYNEIEELAFNKWEDSYIAEVHHQNYKADKSLGFIAPKQVNQSENHIEKDKDGKTWFYVHLPVQQPEVPELRAKKISIVWDASGTGCERNFSKEYQMLEKYFGWLQSVEVELIVFSNDLVGKKKEFSVTNGNWSALRTYLENITYDGGTQLGALDFSKIASDQILLFTDGISNFGKRAITIGNTPIYAICSKLPADHSYLKYLSNRTGGSYIDLINTSGAEAFKFLANRPYRLISAEYDGEPLSEIYPSTSMNVNKDFSFSGIMKSKEATVKLNFGFGNEVKDTYSIKLNADANNDYEGLVKRMWAQKKLAELDVDFENNKEKIIALGTEYSIVTRNTSLIVLESIQDYMQHCITPPDEMIQEFNEEFQAYMESSEALKGVKNAHMEEIVSKFEERQKWWNEEFAAYDSLIKLKATIENALKTIGNDHNTWKGEYDQINKKIYVLVNKMHGQIQEWENMQTEFDDKKSVWTEKVDSYDKLAEDGKNTYYVAELGAKLDSLFAGWRGEFAAQNLIMGDSIVKFHSLIINMESAAKQYPTTYEAWLKEYGQIEKEIEAMKSDSLADKDHWRELQSKLNSKNIEWLDSLNFYQHVAASGNGYNYVKHRKEELQAKCNEWNTHFSEQLKKLNDNISNGMDTSTEPVIDKKIDQDKVSTAKEEYYYIENNISGYGSESNRTMRDGASEMEANAISDPKALDSKKQESNIELNKWNPDTPYLKALKSATGDKYKTYLQLKKEYKGTPSFYLDVADYFISVNENETALRILSNIAELETENHELLRILAYKMMQLGYHELAIMTFKELKEMREEEPQSYRDLGLAYASAKQYQNSINELYEVVSRKWDRFDEIEMIALNEMNAFIFEAEQNGEKPDLSAIDPRLIKNMPVRLRVILSWDADNTDMDLWVLEPAGETCMYNYNRTQIGGRMSRDFTNGYGPEEYLLKKALPGTYFVKANYFGSSRQKISGPVTLQLQLFTNYGTKDQKMEEVTIRLEDAKETVDIGKFLIE